METYLREAFPLPWSADHRKVITKTERAILRGGFFAHAMPRGSGKTAIAIAACTWATLYGHRRYVLLLAAATNPAQELLAKIKTILETNPVLKADFWAEIAPILLLERSPNRIIRQHIDGALTRGEWSAGKVVMPMATHVAIGKRRRRETHASSAQGTVLAACGLGTSEIRGQLHALPSGELVRPEFILVDDPQTRESAWSTQQCMQRLSIIFSDILGTKGPGRRLSMLITCTVIRTGDAADQLLDRKKYPELQGERAKTLYAFPEQMDLWHEYARLRNESLAADGDGSEANAYYLAHREAMDRGAVVGWLDRVDPGDLSALQTAMHWYLRDPTSFASEAQNSPSSDTLELVNRLTAEQIAGKLSGVDRGVVSAPTEKLVAYIDVHQRILYWVVVAWTAEFCGSVIDYGTYPNQGAPYFAEANPPVALQQAHPGRGVDGALADGIGVLCRALAEKTWIRDDGAQIVIDRIGIDTGYKPRLIAAVLRKLGPTIGRALWPGIGLGIGATRRPFSAYRKEAGAVRGHHWRRAKAPATDLLTLFIDTNYWKSFVHDRLATPLGEPGCLSLFGTGAWQHRFFGDHLSAEVPKIVTGPWGTVTQWIAPPGAENHWGDCVVGAAAIGSTLGCVLPEWAKKAAGPGVSLGGMRERRRMSEVQRQKRMGNC